MAEEGRRTKESRRIKGNLSGCQFIRLWKCQDAAMTLQPRGPRAHNTGSGPQEESDLTRVQDVNMAAHPEDLPADVGDPFLFQGVALGVLDQVCDRAGAAELHDQLQTHTGSVRGEKPSWLRSAQKPTVITNTFLPFS